MNISNFSIGDTSPNSPERRVGALMYQNSILTLYAIFAQQDLPQTPQWDKSAKGEIQLGLYTTDGVTTLAAKIGDLPWLSVPYFPQLQNPFDFPPYHSLNDGETLPMNIILIRSEDSQVMGMRLFGPSTAFSREMLRINEGFLRDPISLEDYSDLANIINAKFSPREIGCEKAQVKYVLPASRG